MTWQPDETLVRWAFCGELTKLPTGEVGRRNGHLILTTQRILFVAATGLLNGLILASHEVVYSIDLENISAVSVGKLGLLQDKLAIMDRSGDRKVYAQGGLKSMQGLINRQIQVRQDELRTQQERDRVLVVKHVIIDFSSLKDVLAKGGIQLVVYKCPECGGNLKLPDSGDTLTCSYCGASIRATDVYEKYKSVVG